MIRHPDRRCIAAVSVWLVCALTVRAQQPAVVDSISPGVVYSLYQLEGPNSANVVTVDLRDTTLALEAFQLHGLVRTSEQARALADSGRVVLAAINADFFSFQTGLPVGNAVINGTVAVGLRSKRSHLVISGRCWPYIERTTLVGEIVTRRGDAAGLGAVNTAMPLDQPRLYTPRYGPDTGADSAGVKIVLRMARTPADIRDTTFYAVTGRVVGGKAPIADGGGVLAVPDDVLQKSRGGFLPGDTLGILADFVPYVPDVRQVLGGAGRILRNGLCDTVANQALEDLSLKFQSDRHPRTFVAFDRDTTRLYLCTVDGRQAKSRGMSFGEMAKFLLSLGAWNAVNFDGGGSTTMVVGGKVVNTPSDVTGERPVANILALVRRH
jgi:hypothetical protein